MGKIGDASRTQVSQVIYKFFGSFLAKVYLHKVSSLWDMYNRSLHPPTCEQLKKG